VLYGVGALIVSQRTRNSDCMDPLTEEDRSKNSDTIRLTYIGGPTLLIEYGGLRFLTDPTFDLVVNENYRSRDSNYFGQISPGNSRQLLHRRSK